MSILQKLSLKYKILNAFNNLNMPYRLITNPAYKTIHLFINTSYYINLPPFTNNTNYVIYEVTGDKIYKVLTTCDILVLNLLNNFYINLLSYFIELNYPISSFVYDDPVYDIAYEFCETNNINKAYYLREYHCSLLVDDD